MMIVGSLVDKASITGNGGGYIHNAFLFGRSEKILFVSRNFL